MVDLSFSFDDSRVGNLRVSPLNCAFGWYDLEVTILVCGAFFDDFAVELEIRSNSHWAWNSGRIKYAHIDGGIDDRLNDLFRRFVGDDHGPPGWIISRQNGRRFGGFPIEIAF